MSLEDQTIYRTPNPDCPACTTKRQHRPKEWKKYHPLAGTGFQADTKPINKAAKEVEKL